jgi:predicted phosphodiesterase
MRIAVMADIHGNPIALDGVLQDVEAAGGVDECWILGDLVAIGHGPVEVLERLSALPGTRFARGNTDRYVCTGHRPGPTLEEARADEELMQALAEIAGSFAWTQGAITSAGWLDWLSDLPHELRALLPDGTRLLGVHASPASDEAGIYPALSGADIESLLSDSGADLICAGHTHIPLDVWVNDRHVVNVGSVSNPLPPDLRASYAIIDADETGYEIQTRSVAYDREAVIAAIQRIRHPGAGYIVRCMRGETAAERWVDSSGTGERSSLTELSR